MWIPGRDCDLPNRDASLRSSTRLDTGLQSIYLFYILCLFFIYRAAPARYPVHSGGSGSRSTAASDVTDDRYTAATERHIRRDNGRACFLQNILSGTDPQRRPFVTASRRRRDGIRSGSTDRIRTTVSASGCRCRSSLGASTPDDRRTYYILNKRVESFDSIYYRPPRTDRRRPARASATRSLLGACVDRPISGAPVPSRASPPRGCRRRRGRRRSFPIGPELASGTVRGRPRSGGFVVPSGDSVATTRRGEASSLGLFYSMASSVY